MTNLDDIAAMRALDTVNVLGSVEQLAGQSKQAWEEVASIPFPNSYSGITNIVFSGMGGSALGAYVVKSLLSTSLPVPYEIVNDYVLPAYVSSSTLVLLGSYSGTTEETVTSAKRALEKKALATGLTTGGELAEILRNAGVPSYIFTPKHNPSGQPRLGTGYSVFGILAIFQKLGLVTVETQDVSEVFSILEKGNSTYGVATPTGNNRAKQLAASWVNKIPVIVTGEFLVHVGRVIRNQLHESAKSFAAYHEIPELNHHLMEGLTNPTTNKQTLRFLFVDSPLYCDKIKKRFAITKDVVTKQGIAVDTFVPSARSRLAQVMECIQFGAYANYYMAMLYGLDPSKIPWVDYFKSELAK